jgi:choline-phosphate cytidylyltransferase
MVVRIYADGVFDVLHHGHARVFEQAKTMFDDVYLIVGIHSDEDVHKMKGPTVMTYTERSSMLRHIKWIDEVVEHAPWRITHDFIKEHAIDFVAHDGEPYASLDMTEDLYHVPKTLNIFRSTQRTVGISTTDLVQRILDNSSTYIIRNSIRK